MPTLAELNATQGLVSEGATVLNATINATAKAVKEAVKTVPVEKYNALLNTLHAVKTWQYIYLGIALVAIAWTLFIWYRYVGRIKRLAKKDYGWVHIISAGKLKSYFMKMSSHYRIDGALYIGDESCDLIEYGTNIRHKFFFEDSPYQILFVPTGVKITAPKKVPESVRAKFESTAPKIIHIKSPVSSRVLDALLHRSAIFGKEVTNLGKSFLGGMSKEKAIGIVILIVVILALLKNLFK